MKQYTLLTYHMQDVNPEYMFGHAIVAGMLASKQITTKEQYIAACEEQGVTRYPGAWDKWAEDVGL